MRMPQGWVSPAEKKVTATKVEARIDMGAEVAGAGLCPDCRKPMQPITAGPVETLTCMPCRISIPVADPVVASPGPSTALDQ